jgi:hypothetical protein
MAQINIQAVIDEFGKKYVPGGQTDKDIKTQLFTQEETAKYFRKVPNKGSVYRSAYATISEVLQAYQIDFTPKAALTFKPIEYNLGQFKMDQLFYPDNFRQSWLGFLANIEETDRAKWPILQWYIQHMLIPGYQNDFEKKVSYWGWQASGFVASAPVVNGATHTREFLVGASTPANAAMDGLRLVLQKLQAKSRLNVIVTGAIKTDPIEFCTQIEGFVNSINRDLKQNLDYLFMSHELMERYCDGKGLKYNQQYKQEEDLKSIKHSSIKVAGLRSMEGSSKIFATPAQNRVMAINTDFTGRFDLQKADRGVKLLSDHEKCLCFDVPEFVVTNDLESTITAGEITAMYS